MKIILDIADSKAAAFLDIIKGYHYVKTQTLSAPDADLLEEIKIIKKAFKDAELIKQGKLKSRPIAALLNEL